MATKTDLKSRRGRGGHVKFVFAMVATLLLSVLLPGVASAASQGYSLSLGGTLRNSNSLDRGGRQLIMQNDGNLVYYNNAVNPRVICWASNTSGSNRNFTVAIFQTDGNFVVKNGNTVYWASGTTDHSAGSTVDIEPASGGKYTFYIGHQAKRTC